MDSYVRPAVPGPVNRIFSLFTRSPREDFVILPVEGWANAPGLEETAVASSPGE
jgi:hypothetical protein